MKINDVDLSKICTFVNGGTPRTNVPEYFRGTIPWITGADVNDNVITTARNFITEEAIRNSATNIVPKGNILLVTRTGVGKVAISGVDICISQDFTGLYLDHNRIDTWYLFYYLRFKAAYLISQQRGATIQGITREVVERIRVPLPPLPEQRRIAAILSKADRLRRLRRYARQLGDTFLQSVFVEMFGDLVSNSKGWHFENLGDLAEIASGVTKGQNYGQRKVIEVPYLRVANVQDGYLDLSEIKMISVPPEELEKLRLKAGDILMTEGGDFDKLGRGAIWEGSIENCIHQNHIFRVRLSQQKIRPIYFETFLISQHAKTYFLSASKQTTNLATINMTQLKNLQVAVPPLRAQDKFVLVAKRYKALFAQQGEAERQAELLFQSLLQRAFTGEL